jgi:hypothetical protein
MVGGGKRRPLGELGGVPSNLTVPDGGVLRCLAMPSQRPARGGSLFAVSLAMAASGPAAWSTLALFEFFLRPANTPLARLFLLRVLDPADELISCQRGDVFPRVEGHRIGHQGASQIPR